MYWVKHAFHKGIQALERYTRTDVRYVVKGGSWLSFGSACSALISFATLTAFANLVSQEVYGSYQYVLAFVALLSIFALPGFKAVITRSVARGSEGVLTLAFWAKLKWSLLSVCALLCVAGWYLYHDNTVLAVVFSVAGVLTPFRESFSIFGPFWRGRKRFDYQTLSQLAVSGGAAAAVITTLFLTENLIVIVTVLLGSEVVIDAILYFLARRAVVNEQVEPETLTFSQHLTVMDGLAVISDRIDKFLLWHFLGPVQVAVYSVASDPLKKIRGLAPLKALALPKLSERGVRGIKRKKSIFRKFLLLFVLTLPVALFLIILAPFVYQVVFPQYLESVVYMQVLSATVVFMPFALLSTSFIAEMQTTYLYILRCIPILKIALFVILIPFVGMWGVVAAVLVTEVIQGILVTYFFWRME